MKQKKRTILIVVICALALILALSFPWMFGRRGAERIPGMDLSAGEVIYDVDSHGGILGDGISLEILQFPDESFKALAGESDGWKGFPMDSACREMAELFNEETGRLEPFLDKAVSGTPADGLYLFLDRFSEAADPYDAAAAKERYAYNFTLAIYDCDARQLLIYKLDT